MWSSAQISAVLAADYCEPVYHIKLRSGARAPAASQLCLDFRDPGHRLLRQDCRASNSNRDFGAPMGTHRRRAASGRADGGLRRPVLRRHRRVGCHHISSRPDQTQGPARPCSDGMSPCMWGTGCHATGGTHTSRCDKSPLNPIELPQILQCRTLLSRADFVVKVGREWRLEQPRSRCHPCCCRSLPSERRL